MKKLFFILAFALVGTFAFANEETNKSTYNNDSKLTDSHTSIDTINYSYNELFYGRCSAIVTHYDEEGNMTGIFLYTWESVLSDIEGGCALDARIIEFCLNHG